MLRKEKINEIIEFLKDNEPVLNSCAEQLDAYNGFLGDNRYIDMEYIDEYLHGMDISVVLQKAFFGEDGNTWLGGSGFNPNRNYFYFNAYGNLVSSDYKEYSDVLDEYLIEDLAENRAWVDIIDLDNNLCRMFNELERLED